MTANKPRLSPLDFRVLTYYARHLERHQIAPSRITARRALDLSSDRLTRSLNALTDNGFIERVPFRARAIRVLRWPTDLLEGNTQ